MIYKEIDFEHDLGTSGLDRIALYSTFDPSDIWLQERLLVLVEGVGGRNYECTATDWNDDTLVSGVFTADENGCIIVDLSDLFRVYRDDLKMVTIREKVAHTPDYITIEDFTYSGLISPNSVLSPRHDLDDAYIVLPPSVMIEPVAPDVPIIAEGRVGAGVTNARMIWYDGTTEHSTLLADGVFSIGESGLKWFYVQARTFFITKKTPICYATETDCTRHYAYVEWVSFTGSIRRHVFEVVGLNATADGIISLEQMNNDFLNIRGRIDAFSLRIDGLNAYDFWYYADMILSSDVRVSFDGDKWQRVEVADKKYEIPELTEGKLVTLEIPVNVKKYDAVSL